MEEAGGLLTMDDLAQNRVDVYAAPRSIIAATRVYETAPPSQGFVVLPMSPRSCAVPPAAESD